MSPTPFDITHEHIKKLTESQLPQLIGKLCEAELSKLGIPISYVTYSGNLKAPDGGIDVRLSAPASEEFRGFLPSNNIGFQVKQIDGGMEPSKIINELGNGTLPSEVRKLADSGGTYIMVSGHDNVSASMLSNRKNTISNLYKEPSDFYDGSKIAQWVNTHPGTVLWVREQIGEPLIGWKYYKNWSSSPSDQPYILDEQARLRPTGKDPIAIDAAIDLLRCELQKPHAAVRLVGLSGMGKTRLAQALFEANIGTIAPLRTEWAVYTDTADEPHPPAIEMINRLAQQGRRAIMIVDNCSLVIHKRLANQLKDIHHAPISLLTIELDVTEETESETTAYFRLEPASYTLIQKIIQQHVPRLIAPAIARILDLSGGNARLALALAKGLATTDKVSDLTDREIFDRLFYQGSAPNRDLEKTAQACSLVNAFYIEPDNFEIPRLAAIVRQDSHTFYANLQELKRRQLLQQRGRQAAILPQALAKHLAHRAWEDCAPSILQQQLDTDDAPRLRLSLSRRLGTLNDCEPAHKFAQAWLAPGGILGPQAPLTRETFDLLENIAPIAEDAALQRLSRPLPEDLLNESGVFSLLAKLAYAPERFQRSVSLMTKLSSQTNDRNIERYFCNLFYPRISGTHAPLTARLEFIESLLHSNTPESVSLAKKALDAVLSNYHHSFTFDDFNFGSQNRNFGYIPKDREEHINWYRATLDWSLKYACQADAVGDAIRSSIASNIRGLWLGFPEFRNELSEILEKVSAMIFCPKISNSLSKIIECDSDMLSASDIETVNAVIIKLSPRELRDRIRDSLKIQYYNRYITDKMAFKESQISIGVDLANNLDLLSEFLQDFFHPNSDQHAVFNIGVGLVKGAANLDAIWSKLIEAVSDTDQSIQIFRGFLHYAHSLNSDWTEQKLEECLNHPRFLREFPTLQFQAGLNERGFLRLLKSAALEGCPVDQFSNLAVHLERSQVPISSAIELIDILMKRGGGFFAGVSILADYIRLKPSENTLVELALLFLQKCQIHSNIEWNQVEDICSLIKHGLPGQDGDPAANYIAQQLSEIMLNQESSEKLSQIIKTMIEIKPEITLEKLERTNFKKAFWAQRVLREAIQETPVDTLWAWADAAPSTRYLWLAEFVTLFSSSPGHTEATYREKHLAKALALIERAPNRQEVLNKYGNGFMAGYEGWPGNLSERYDEFRALLAPWQTHNDPIIQKWARDIDEAIENISKAERRTEAEWQREKQRFE
jgi:hypothetical protein